MPCLFPDGKWLLVRKEHNSGSHNIKLIPMFTWNRRAFIKHTAIGTMAVSLFPSCMASSKKPDENANAVMNANPADPSRFKISLAEWSLHRTIFDKMMDHLDFAKTAAGFGITGIEYVNQFFKDKATDSAYLEEMNMRARDLNIQQLLIMIDGEGGLADTDDKKRDTAVSNHYKWVDAAKILGCHSIRVNAYGESDDRIALHASAVEGLSDLAEYALPMGINVIVENHGGFSSDGLWLKGVMDEINMPNCGTLPDFGNFCIQREGEKCVQEYDRYKGVAEMIGHAKAISAKSYDFNTDGHETTIDYIRMMDIIKASAYSGFIGIEYEGTRMPEFEGIVATKKLLERVISS